MSPVSQARRSAVSEPLAIITSSVSKRYGPTTALDKLTLAVPPGEIFGYLGPNGAGKTTTIRLLLDLIRPTSGTISVLGLDPRHDSRALRRRVGYLPGELVLYEQLSGAELLSPRRPPPRRRQLGHRDRAR